MEIQELRIDNYVSYGVNMVKVKSMHIESVLKSREDVYIELNTNLPHYCVNLSEVKPIPLTEEILLRLGFENPAHSWNGKIFHLSEWNDYPLNWEVAMNKNGEVIVKKLKYVHQLQNLYYALTGEELTLK